MISGTVSEAHGFTGAGGDATGAVIAAHCPTEPTLSGVPDGGGRRCSDPKYGLALVRRIATKARKTTPETRRSLALHEDVLSAEAGFSNSYPSPAMVERRHKSVA